MVEYINLMENHLTKCFEKEIRTHNNVYEIIAPERDATLHILNVITNKIKNELQKQIKYFDNDTTNIVINSFFLY